MRIKFKFIVSRNSKLPSIAQESRSMGIIRDIIIILLNALAVCQFSIISIQRSSIRYKCKLETTTPGIASGSDYVGCFKYAETQCNFWKMLVREVKRGVQ